MKKRILSFILIVAMLLGVAPMAFAAPVCEYGDKCPSKGFADVPADAWFHKAIDLMVETGVMNGVSKKDFDPNGQMTRAMYATILYRAYGNGEKAGASKFSDVENGSWYAAGVAWAEKNGIVLGVGDGKFDPHGILTREQMVVMNYRYTKFSGGYIPKKPGDLSAFKDAGLISSWAKEAMAWAVGEGMIKGDGNGYLNPVDNATRSEGACALIQYEEAEVLYPDSVVESEKDLIKAIEAGGDILVDTAFELADDTVINVTKDVNLLLYVDLDLSNNSRPFNVSNGAEFTVEAGNQTVKMGKYGLVNIVEGDATVSLKGGNYVGKTDNGSLIKPRGNGNIEIFLEDVNVKDESDNGGWLVNGDGQTGNVTLMIDGGIFESYNGIAGADQITVKDAKMTFVHNAFEITKHAEIEGCTIKVLNGGTALENGNAPSSTIAVSNNGYALVKNCTLDGANHALAIYTSGGTIEAVNNKIVNGTFAEYHDNYYKDAIFKTTVDGKIPATLLFPNCKTPCKNCITFVSDEADLRAAVAAGGKIALAKDIQMDGDTTINVVSGKEIDLDLNGYTLKGVTDNAGNSNREMFLVKGEMSVKNGTVAMEHQADNMGWNAMTAIFDVTAGGILNIEKVTVKNLGGTAMTFGVHLNNWGKVTLNVKDSVITANYCAVRVFNSGFDMNNVSIYDSVLHGDNRAFWVHNYIGDLNSSQHSDDAIKARLNFDILNGTNELTNGTAEAPKNNPIRYGYANATYYDAQGNDVTVR